MEEIAGEIWKDGQIMIDSYMDTQTDIDRI